MEADVFAALSHRVAVWFVHTEVAAVETEEFFSRMSRTQTLNPGE